MRVTGLELKICAALLLVVGVGIAARPTTSAPVLQTAGEVADVVSRAPVGGSYYQVVLRCNHGRYVLVGPAGSLAHRAYADRTSGLFWVQHDGSAPGADTQFRRMDPLPR